MNEVVKIGTRDSKLALWQANHTKNQLGKLNIPVKIIKIKSQGDLNQTTPLYEFGVTGIFTKNLDRALLNNEIAEDGDRNLPCAPRWGSISVKLTLSAR